LEARRRREQEHPEQADNDAERYRFKRNDTHVFEPIEWASERVTPRNFPVTQ
jgi:hypothetical protein